MKSLIRRSFTLVELLTVIAVIGILSAIGMGVYSTAQNKSRISATRALVENIAGAFEAAKSDVGYVPAASSWTEITFNVVLIDSVGYYTVSNLGDGRFKKAFSKHADKELIRKFLENGESGNLIDSWGKEIYYCYPGIANKTKCCVLSAGPDGLFGNNTEPSNPPPSSLSSYKSGGEWACDDVGNF